VTLDEVRADWTRLGAEDPLWAVYVAPGTRGGRWDLDEFFATGQREVDGALAEAARLGLRPGRRRALDFGCGVGRLSAALARRVDEVVGVDIAPTMLAEARRLDRSGGRCRFVCNDRPDLAVVPDGSVDVVYSSLVLQHLPRTLALAYVTEFARVLAPDGIAVFQVATRPTRSVRGAISALLPWPVLRWVQRQLLGYPAPMRMGGIPARDVRTALAAGGARIVGSVEDSSYRAHWVCTRYFAVRDGGPPGPAAGRRQQRDRNTGEGHQAEGLRRPG
jgi:SAM-dependent methyltransferase